MQGQAGAAIHFFIAGVFNQCAALFAALITLSGILGQAARPFLPFPDFPVQTAVYVAAVEVVLQHKIKPRGNTGLILVFLNAPAIFEAFI